MSDINIQTFSGKVNISNNLKVGQGHLFVDTLNNQVGLNTNTPAASLHVNGNTFVNTDLRVGTKVLIDSGATDSNVIEVTNGNIKAEFLHGDGSNITSISADNIDGTLSQWTGAVGSSIYYAENVGIGLTNPQFKLDVNGDANVGVLTATFLHGDGSNIANIVSSQWEGSPGDPIYYDGNVGIATTSAPTRTLEVGSNFYVEDAGSNVLVVDGNVAVESISVGDFTIVASQGLDHVTNENNTTTQVVQFNHPTTGFITAANAVIGGTLSLQNFALSQSYGLENVTDVNNTTGDTIVSSNATTGFQSTANVSVGRDALVTGNVTVGKDLTVTEEAAFSSNVTIGKDLEVSGNVTNLDVLSNVNLLSVSNVVSIKKDSNVVTEFPRSKKLIKYPRVALTGSTSGGYTVETSNEQSTHNAWEAFDNYADGSTTNYRWRTNDNRYTNNSSTGTPSSPTGAASTYLFTGSEAGDWISVEFPEKMKLVYFTITGIHYHTPYEGVIYGYNTSTSTWEKVTSFINKTGNDGTNNPVYSPSFYVHEGNTKYYSKYAMIVVKTNGHHAPSMYEWKLFGLPEYDPDAAGMDVKVTSYPNVPNTDWLEVYYDAKESSSYPGTGGTVLDLSGNGKNGTLNGDVGFDSEYKAFTFDGNGDYIKTTLTGFTGTTVTFSAWVFIDSIDTSRVNTIMGLGSWGSTGSAAWIAVGTSGTLETGNKGITNCRGSVQATTLTKRWLHITGIVSSGDFRFFQDGQLLNSLTTTGTINYGTDPVLYLATRANSSGDPEATRYLDCKIANARLFNRALTSDEVWQLYSYQKEYFGHGDLSMTLKVGRLGIGTSEPRAALDVRGDIVGSSPVYFYLGIDDDSHVAATTKIPFHIIRANKGGGYDEGTYNFTAPIGGWYWMAFGGVNRSSSSVLHMSLKDGPNSSDTTLLMAYDRPYGQSLMHAHRSGLVYIREGGVVSLWVTSSTVDAGNGLGGASVEWGGFLVSRDFNGKN